MTKEELEKEAEEYGIDNFEQCMYDDVKGWETDCKARVQAYIDGAEPREKQIQIDAEQIRNLQKQNGELTDKVRELEAQIEKMKSDVKEEIGFAKNFDELHTYNVLNNLLNRWEIKEK